MQGLRSRPNDVVHLDLNPPTPSTFLSIDGSESAEARIRRLISEHPVIIFSRSACCMCHVMRNLLATIGVHPTVIELEDHELSVLPHLSQNDTAASLYSSSSSSSSSSSDNHRQQFSSSAAPSVFIGGTCVGGLESLMGLHLSGHLVSKLRDAGALGMTF